MSSGVVGTFVEMMVVIIIEMQLGRTPRRGLMLFGSPLESDLQPSFCPEPTNTADPTEKHLDLC